MVVYFVIGEYSIEIIIFVDVCQIDIYRECCIKCVVYGEIFIVVVEVGQVIFVEVGNDCIQVVVVVNVIECDIVFIRRCKGEGIF